MNVSLIFPYLKKTKVSKNTEITPIRFFNIFDLYFYSDFIKKVMGSAHRNICRLEKLHMHLKAEHTLLRDSRTNVFFEALRRY